MYRRGANGGESGLNVDIVPCEGGNTGNISEVCVKKKKKHAENVRLHAGSFEKKKKKRDCKGLWKKFGVIKFMHHLCRAAGFF